MSFPTTTIEVQELETLQLELGKAVSSAAFYKEKYEALAKDHASMKHEAGFSALTPFRAVWKATLRKAQKAPFEFKHIKKIVEDEGEVKLQVECCNCDGSIIIGEDEAYCFMCGEEFEELNILAWTEYSQYEKHRKPPEKK